MNLKKSKRLGVVKMIELKNLGAPDADDETKEDDEKENDNEDEKDDE